MPAKLDLTGQTFNKLTVIKEAPRVASNKSRWYCRCECGNEIAVHTMHLRSGHTKSCGCIPRQNSDRVMNEEGEMVRPDGYHSWKAIQSRCYSKSDSSYPRYGGAGITMCDRWRGKDGLKNFLADMGPRPSPEHSVGRIDWRGNYCPENCEWQDHIEQGRNKKNTYWLTLGNKTQGVRDWERELGLAVGGLRARLRRGWPLEQALTLPGMSPKKKRSQLKAETASVRYIDQWAGVPDWMQRC